MIGKVTHQNIVGVFVKTDVEASRVDFTKHIVIDESHLEQTLDRQGRHSAGVSCQIYVTPKIQLQSILVK